MARVGRLSDEYVRPLTAAEIETLTYTLLGEAEGEGAEGMYAVANVIRNRTRSPLYPDTALEVALQPWQFSTNNPGEGGNQTAVRQRNPAGSELYRQAEQIVRTVIVQGQGPDITGNAINYHADYVSPYWANGATTRWGTVQIGNHIFYARRPVPPLDIPAAVASALDVAPVPATASPRIAFFRAGAPLPRRDPRQAVPSASQQLEALRQETRLQQLMVERTRQAVDAMATAKVAQDDAAYQQAIDSLREQLLRMAAPPSTFPARPEGPAAGMPAASAFDIARRRAIDSLREQLTRAPIIEGDFDPFAPLDRSSSLFLPRPEGPAAGMPGVPYEPTVAGRPEYPAGMPAAPYEPVVGVRPEGPAAGMPAATPPPGPFPARPEGEASGLPAAPPAPGPFPARPEGPASGLPAAPLQSTFPVRPEGDASGLPAASEYDRARARAIEDLRTLLLWEPSVDRDFDPFSPIEEAAPSTFPARPAVIAPNTWPRTSEIDVGPARGGVAEANASMPPTASGTFPARPEAPIGELPAAPFVSPFPARPEGPAAGMPAPKATATVRGAATAGVGVNIRMGTSPMQMGISGTPGAGVGVIGSISEIWPPMPADPSRRPVAAPTATVTPLQIQFEPMNDRSGAALAESIGRPIVTPSGRLYGDGTLTGGIPIGTVRGTPNGMEYEWTVDDNGKLGWYPPQNFDAPIRAPVTQAPDRTFVPQLQPVPATRPGTVVSSFPARPAVIAPNTPQKSASEKLTSIAATVTAGNPLMAPAVKLSVRMPGVAYTIAPRPAPPPEPDEQLRTPTTVPEPSGTGVGRMSDEYVKPAVKPAPVTMQSVAPQPAPRPVSRVPQYIEKTVQVANPAYADYTKAQATLKVGGAVGLSASGGTSWGAMTPVTPAAKPPPQYLTKTIMVPNPAYRPSIRQASPGSPAAIQRPTVQTVTLASGSRAAVGSTFDPGNGYTYRVNPDGSVTNTGTGRVTAPASGSRANTGADGATYAGTSSSGRQFNLDTSKWEDGSSSSSSGVPQSLV